MSKFTKEMIDDYAEKLLIGLTDDENEMVLNEFEIIDKNIDLINKIDGIEKVEPMSWCLDTYAPALREDVAKESITREEAFKNCDVHTDTETEVPAVVG